MPNEPIPAGDVRMRGFANRVLVEDAIAWIDEYSQPGPAETVAIDESHGRVLAADVLAEIDVPEFDRAAMDGYALRGAETNGASDYNPVTFRVVGESLPGRAFSGTITPGSAVRIMTGAPLPAMADAVLPVEYARQSVDGVEVTTTVAQLKHVGRRGEDVARGAKLLSRGRRLRPQDVGLAASVGLHQVSVRSRPRVRILTTGNEVVEPGGPKGEYEIFDANSTMLLGLVLRDGAELESKVHVLDDRDAIRRAMLAPGADVILVSGGSSVGAEDHAPSIVAVDGELAIHGIAMRPSSPAGMGSFNSSLVFLLPGNPVSCLCAYDFFAGRAIRRLGGRSVEFPYATQTAKLARKLVSSVGRVDYCRVCVRGGRVEPLAISGASILSSTSRADGFVIVPAELEGYAPESEVTVYRYESAEQGTAD